MMFSGAYPTPPPALVLPSPEHRLRKALRYADIHFRGRETGDRLHASGRGQRRTDPA